VGHFSYKGIERMAYGSGKNRILLHPARPRWMILNPTGYEISRELFRGESPDEVANLLCERYDIASETALRDVSRVKDRLYAEAFFPLEALAAQPRIPSPRSLFLHITNRCNLSCVHCYEAVRDGSKPMDIATDFLFRLIDQLKALGGRAVTVSGGGTPSPSGYRDDHGPRRA